MQAIHFICKTDIATGQPIGLSHDRQTKMFRSEAWDIRREVAEALVGGWIYLHATKASLSYFGGQIRDFTPVYRPDCGHPHRIDLLFSPRSEAKGRLWRGRDHGPAWTSGLVRADLPHEQKEWAQT